MKLFTKDVIRAESREEVLAFAEKHVVAYLHPDYTWQVRTREVSANFWEYTVFRGKRLGES